MNNKMTPLPSFELGAVLATRPGAGDEIAAQADALLRSPKFREDVGIDPKVTVIPPIKITATLNGESIMGTVVALHLQYGAVRRIVTLDGHQGFYWCIPETNVVTARCHVNPNVPMCVEGCGNPAEMYHVKCIPQLCQDCWAFEALCGGEISSGVTKQAAGPMEGK